MKDSDTFRENAENCLRLAERSTDERRPNAICGWRKPDGLWPRSKTGSMEKRPPEVIR